MSKRSLRAMLGVAVAGAALMIPAGSATAGHTTCHTRNDVFKAATGSDRVSVAGTVYIDDRATPASTGVPAASGLASGNGTWVYVEDNQIGGLQRGGVSVILGDVDPENCNESSNPDMLIL